MATSTIQYLYRLTGNMYPSICLSYLLSKITPDDFYWNFSTPVKFLKKLSISHFMFEPSDYLSTESKNI